MTSTPAPSPPVYAIGAGRTVTRNGQAVFLLSRSCWGDGAPSGASLDQWARELGALVSPGPALANLARLPDHDIRTLIGLARSRAEDLGELYEADPHARTMQAAAQLANVNRIFGIIDGEPAGEVSR